MEIAFYVGRASIEEQSEQLLCMGQFMTEICQAGQMDRFLICMTSLVSPGGHRVNCMVYVLIAHASWGGDPYHVYRSCSTSRSGRFL